MKTYKSNVIKNKTIRQFKNIYKIKKQKGGMILLNIEDMFNHEKVYEKVKIKRMQFTPPFRDFSIDLNQQININHWVLHKYPLIKSIEDIFKKWNIKLYIGYSEHNRYYDTRIYNRLNGATYLQYSILLYTNKNMIIRTELPADRSFDTNRPYIIIQIYEPNNIKHILYSIYLETINGVNMWQETYKPSFRDNINKNILFDIKKHSDLIETHLVDYINPNIYLDYMSLLPDEEITNILNLQNSFEKEEENQIYEKYNELKDEYIKILKLSKNLSEENKSLTKELLKKYPKTPKPKPTPLPFHPLPP